MHNEELSNKLMAEVFDDDFISSAPPEVRDFVNDLLLELATTPSARPDTSLVEFLDVASLPSQPMVVSAGPTRSKKMITGIGAFVATTVGKVVLGTAIAAASVGGAHAAEIVDIPGLPDRGTVVIENEVEPAAYLEAPLDTEVEVGAVVDANDDANDDANNDANNDADVVDEEAADEGEDASHGSVVSEFVATTELEGCEGRQAIAEVASSQAADHRQNGEPSNDPCADDDLEVDANDDADVVDDEAADEGEDASHGSVVSEFVATTELEGCERGQAIAEVASSQAADHRQNGEPSNDPCADDEVEVDVIDEADDANEPAPEDLGPPVDAGRPEDVGPPVDAGRPEDVGPPVDAGRPEDVGPPAKPGR
jgi:hypothetical protein